jgi:hypothetical protein
VGLLFLNYAIGKKKAVRQTKSRNRFESQEHAAQKPRALRVALSRLHPFWICDCMDSTDAEKIVT